MEVWHRFWSDVRCVRFNRFLEGSVEWTGRTPQDPNGHSLLGPVIRRPSEVCTLFAMNSYVYATAADAPIIIAPDFAHMSTGEAANPVWTQAIQLIAQIHYAVDLGPYIIEPDGGVSNPWPRLRRRPPTIASRVSTETG